MPKVLDVDDAIWLNQRFQGIDRLAESCHLILCGNEYIAEHFRPACAVRVLPTAVDTDRWKPGVRGERPTIVWSGSSTGLPYLRGIEGAIAEVLRALPEARLRVVCDKPPDFKLVPAAQCDYIPWSPDTEVAAVQTATVGLMPMPDTPWTRGKCSLKLLTYLACGIPSVASPHGMNLDVIAGGGAYGAKTNSEWVGLLLTLLRDHDLAHSAGKAGRAQVVDRYSIVKLAPELSMALRQVATDSAVGG